MDRKQAIEFLMRRPALFGQLVGFKKLRKIHNIWIRKMVAGRVDETLQGHRGSYKTSCVSVALSLLILLRPSLRMLFIRKTDDDVKEIISQVKKILSTPQVAYFSTVIWGVNLRLTTDNAFEISTNLSSDIKGTVQLRGVGSKASITGRHYDFIFTDDIVNLQDRASRAERNRVKDFYMELQNIKNPGGKIFNTGTPWHKDDCFSIMPEPEKWDCYSTGIMTPEEIQDKKDSMSPSLFAANYELKHIADEFVIFADPRVGADPSLVEQGVCHIDAAYGGEDYTAFTICRKTNGTIYIMGKLWQKAVDEVEDEIISLRRQYLCGKIYAEDNADKGYLAKSLRKKGERVSSYHESENKYMKIVTYLKGEWRNVIFVDGTDPEYIDQICDYNENAEHDDAPDSLASIVRILRNRDNAGGERQYQSIYGGVY